MRLKGGGAVLGVGVRECRSVGGCIHVLRDGKGGFNHIVFAVNIPPHDPGPGKAWHSIL
jgi:hypothetical protein